MSGPEQPTICATSPLDAANRIYPSIRIDGFRQGTIGALMRSAIASCRASLSPTRRALRFWRFATAAGMWHFLQLEAL
jgi:hypothetical protein